VREATEALMKSYGFRVQVFSSAIDFLARSRTEKTSCMIVDVNMPQMSGVELYEDLVRQGYAIPTILITAFPDADTRERALAMGVRCYLAKPFLDETLLHCVQSAIGDEAQRLIRGRCVCGGDMRDRK
jgi:FixJ family two-component response regulator